MIELHRKLLGDRVRNAAFMRALKDVIEPGKTVVADLGAGTGYLSFLARNLGAKECHLYEYGDVIDIAKKIAKLNDIEGCQFIRKHSVDVKNPPRVDVVISETLGNYALEENIVETLEDGKRFLKKRGIMIPGKIRQFMAPLVSDRLFKEIDVWGEIEGEIDFSHAREVCLNNMYVKTVRLQELYQSSQSGLPRPRRSDAIQQWDDIDFSKKNESVRKRSVDWQIDQDATIYGFVLWWEAELIPGVVLSTSPMAQATHWEQIYLPVLRPLECKRGHTLKLDIVSDSRFTVKINVSWKIEQFDATKKSITKQALDMRRGHIH